MRLTEADGNDTGALIPAAPAIARTEIRREHLGACVILDKKAHRYTEMGLPRLERLHCQPGTGCPESSHSINTSGAQSRAASMVGLIVLSRF